MNLRSPELIELKLELDEETLEQLVKRVGSTAIRGYESPEEMLQPLSEYEANYNLQYLSRLHLTNQKLSLPVVTLGSIKRFFAEADTSRTIQQAVSAYSGLVAHASEHHNNKPWTRPYLQPRQCDCPLEVHIDTPIRRWPDTDAFLPDTVEGVIEPALAEPVIFHGMKITPQRVKTLSTYMKGIKTLN